jgi:hypothetical protein
MQKLSNFANCWSQNEKLAQNDVILFWLMSYESVVQN